jgi:hypothetical protein
MPIHVTGGNHGSPRSTRGVEFYATPRCAVIPLLAKVQLPNVVWDPCGSDDSELAATLREAGKQVFCNDITADGVDFRTRREAPSAAEAIVTNPPFSLAADFVMHGLTLVRRICILERIQFLESESRGELFDAGKLMRVFVFRNRVPRMHASGWEGPRASPAMVLAWFIFDNTHGGAKPTLDWIRC